MNCCLCCCQLSWWVRLKLDRVFFTVICNGNHSLRQTVEGEGGVGGGDGGGGGHSYLDGLRVVEVSAQVHQQLGHPGGHVVGAGQDAGAQAQDAGVAPHQVCQERTEWLCVRFQGYAAHCSILAASRVRNHDFWKKIQLKSSQICHTGPEG